MQDLITTCHNWNHVLFGLCIGCPTSYRTRHFFNFTTNEDIATKFEADLLHCIRNVTTSKRVLEVNIILLLLNYY